MSTQLLPKLYWDKPEPVPLGRLLKREEDIAAMLWHLIRCANRQCATPITHAVAVGSGFNTAWIPKCMGHFHFGFVDAMADERCALIPRKFYEDVIRQGSKLPRPDASDRQTFLIDPSKTNAQ